MNDTTVTIIVAVIASIATLGGAFITVRTQLKNDRETRKQDAKIADEEKAVDIAQIKRELETELWLRLQEDFKKERKKRKELEKTVEMQGAVIMQLRQQAKERDESHQKQIADIKSSHERQLSSLRASMRQIQQEMTQERELRIKAEKEAETLRKGNGGRRV